MSLLTGTLPILINAAGFTVVLTILCLTGGTIIGVVAGIAATMGIGWMRRCVGVYVFIIRGIPLLIQLFFAYFFVPFIGINLPGIVVVGVVMCLYSGALITELVRGAIESIPRIQVDSAKSLGMGRAFRLRRVILPQAARYALPSYIGIAVMLVKLTSLASLVNVPELMAAARAIVERTMDPFGVLLMAAAIYFLICYTLSVFGRALERRFAYLH